MKYYISMLGLSALALLLSAFAIMFLLAVSYLSLIAINYSVLNIPIVGLADFKIEIIHILLFAIFLALIITPRSSRLDKETENYIHSNLNLLFQKIDELNSNIDDIKRTAEEINLAANEIKDK